MPAIVHLPRTRLGVRSAIMAAGLIIFMLPAGPRADASSRLSTSYRNSVSISYGGRTLGPPRRSSATIAYDNGWAHGAEIGWEDGYHDGYRRLRYRSDTTMRLNGYNRHYRQGFRDGYRAEYRRAFTEGKYERLDRRRDWRRRGYRTYRVYR